MKAIIWKGRNMVKEIISGAMVHNILEIGLIIRSMDVELILG